MKNKSIIKLLAASLASLFLAFLPISVYGVNAETTAAAPVWKNCNDAEIAADGNGNIVSANGALYCADPLEVMDGKSGEKSVKIEYSLKKETDTTHQFKFVFTSETIENYASYKDKLGTTANYIGFALVYGNGKYATKTIQYGASSDAGNWKNNLYATFDPVDEAKHTLEMFFSSAGVRAKIDGADFVKQNTSEPYYFVKKDGSNYTISDFTHDGAFRVYLGIDGAYSFKTTVYKPEKPAAEEENVIFDGTAWKNSSNASVMDFDGDKISVSGGLYNTQKLAGVNYDKDSKTMKVNVRFTVNALNQYSQHLVPFIASDAFGNWQNGWGGVGNSANTIALRMYYASDWRFNNNSIFARVCDYKNYQTSGYAAVNPTDGAEHTLSFVFTETSAYVEIDGKGVETAQNSGITYLCKKNATESYTINDFLKDGEPSVYFGILCNAEFGSATVNGNEVTEERLDAMLNTSLTSYGASLRISSPFGLRFENSVNKTHYDYLVKTYGEKNVEVGTLIVPADLVGNADITADNENVLKGVRTTWKNEERGEYCAVLSQIPEEFYGREIIGRPYLTIKMNGVGKTYYGESITRSVKIVAKAILDDYDKTTDATAESPATREDENGYNYLVTYDGNTYFYARITQADAEVLLDIVGTYEMTLYLGEESRAELASAYDSCVVVYSAADGKFAVTAANYISDFINSAFKGFSSITERSVFPSASETY